jgi:protein-S-isoprenylcysteine O-methyltransferase Ste14
MFFLKSSEAIRNALPLAITLPLAVLILIASAYMARTGLKKVFGEIQENPGVIRGGVFNIVRHPIYLSALLLYCGLLLLAFSKWAALVWIIAIPFYHYLALFEEKLLLKRFGEEYRAYMDAVPMWIPKLKRQ